MIEEIAKAGQLLAFHCGVDAYEQTHPFRIAKIARQFPDTEHVWNGNVPDAERGRYGFGTAT